MHTRTAQPFLFEPRATITMRGRGRVGNKTTYHFLLLLGVGVDPSSVLGSPVASLPVNLGGVDAPKEHAAELFEAHLGRVVEYLTQKQRKRTQEIIVYAYLCSQFKPVLPV